MFTARDLLLFFVAFEVVLVPMWFVVAFWGDDGSTRGTCRWPHPRRPGRPPVGTPPTASCSSPRSALR